MERTRHDPVTLGGQTVATPEADEADVRLERFLGHVPLAVTFADGPDDPVTAEIIKALDAHQGDFGEVHVVIVVDGAPAAAARYATDHGLNVSLLADPDDRWRRAFDVPSGIGRVSADGAGEVRAVTSLLFDAQGTVITRVCGAAGGVYADEVLDRATQRDLGA